MINDSIIQNMTPAQVYLRMIKTTKLYHEFLMNSKNVIKQYVAPNETLIEWINKNFKIVSVSSTDNDYYNIHEEIPYKIIPIGTIKKINK